MIYRLCNPLKSNSFFLFGARGTGKSTLVKELLQSNSIAFDLLEPETFDDFLSNPKKLEDFCNGQYEWIILDEVQRVPKLLNVVHRMIELKKQKFAITGSSSRKLRRGQANLLAGRAYVNHLYPLTSIELKEQFDLNHALHWGTLPKIYSLTTPEEKRAYLRSYCLTYIKEEIQTEQVVRKLEPFREFLAVAAQSSGKIINYSSIGRDVGAQVPTVQNYFQILEDTHLGFILPHYHRSVRKSQIESPKFYFFDNGIKKSLEGSLDSKPTEGTSTYGELFEAFLIQEIYRLNDYYQKDWRFAFFKTKNDAEIDLVLSKGKTTLLIEIKSSQKIDQIEVKKFSRLANDFSGQTQAYYLSRDKHKTKIEGIECCHWQDFLDKFKEIN